MLLGMCGRAALMLSSASSVTRTKDEIVDHSVAALALVIVILGCVERDSSEVSAGSVVFLGLFVLAAVLFLLMT